MDRCSPFIPSHLDSCPPATLFIGRGEGEPLPLHGWPRAGIDCPDCQAQVHRGRRTVDSRPWRPELFGGEGPCFPGPVMLITATGNSQASAMELLDEVVQVIPANLAVMQDQLRIPTFSRVEVMTIVQDHTAVLLIKDQLRVLLAAVAGGLAVTVLVTALFDRVMISRRKKKDERRIQSSNQIPPLLENPEAPHLETQPSARRRAAGPGARKLVRATGPLATDQELEIPAAASKQ